MGDGGAERVSESVKKKNCDEKTRNKRSGDSMLQIFVRCMFKTWNTI